MSVESKLKERNKKREELKSIEDNIKQNIRDKFSELGIGVQEVNIESAMIEFDVIVSNTVNQEQIMEIETQFDSIKFSAVKPINSDRYGSVMQIYFN